VRPSTVIASVFGIGYFPFASGTVASAVVIPLAIPILMYGGAVALGCASLIAFAIGVWACGDHVRATGREDPSECVIDEVAGQWLACAFAPLSLPGMALAFVLFRLFDIWKPWPVGWADRELPGGLGVMADDMLAGLMAGVLVAALRYFLPL
jgi:phosphatidylglycerophosphatase A